MSPSRSKGMLLPSLRLTSTAAAQEKKAVMSSYLLSSDVFFCINLSWSMLDPVRPMWSWPEKTGEGNVISNGAQNRVSHLIPWEFQTRVINKYWNCLVGVTDFETVLGSLVIGYTRNSLLKQQLLSYVKRFRFNTWKVLN